MEKMERYYLNLLTPLEASSASNLAQNVVCASCWVCFEHANSAPHNNAHLCLCDDCRAEIGKEDPRLAFAIAKRQWQKAIKRGEVCEEYLPS